MNYMEEWKRILLNLPDQTFFYIMRNYLGNVNTPFNKHNLIRDLTSLFTREDNRNALLNLIDQKDAMLLTAIALLDNPAEEDLYHFFEDRITFMDMHYQLLNLEERLFIFRDPQDAKKRIHFSPFFEEHLAGAILNPGLLFPSKNLEVLPIELWLQQNTLLAFFSYLTLNPSMVRSNGCIKKKNLDELQHLFSDDLTEQHFLLIINTLSGLGLISMAHQKISWNYNRWVEFAELPRQQILLQLWSGWLFDYPDTRNLQKGAEFLNLLLLTLPEFQGLPKESFTRVLRLAARKAGLKSEISYSAILENLLLLELVITKDDHYFQNPAADSLLTSQPPHNSRNTESQPVIIQGNFDLTLPPGISVKNGLLPAMIGELKSSDLMLHFQISRDGLLCALNSGIPYPLISEQLQTITAGRIPQNVRFSLDSWADEYNQLQLFEGVVLVAKGDRALILQHSPEVQQWIKQELAPGVYLMDKRMQPEWETALKRTGVNMIPKIIPATPGFSDLSEGFLEIQKKAPLRFFENFSAVPKEHKWNQNETALSVFTEEELTESQSNLLDKLEALNLPQKEEEEKAMRIKKKLIFKESQLKSPYLFEGEVTEAKGLDYTGKVRLIEQAASTGLSFLELTIPDENADFFTIMVKPDKTVKENGDLILEARQMPEEEQVRIKVRRISRVRRLKGTLFAP